MSTLKKLPDIWHIIVTSENKKAVSKWRFEDDVNYLKVGDIAGMDKPVNGPSKKAHLCPEGINDVDYNFGEELSYDDFRRLVLGHKVIAYQLMKDYPGSEVEGTIFNTERLMELYESYPEFFKPLFEDEELKIGDWVTVIGNRTGWLIGITESTFKITEKKSQYQNGFAWGVRSMIHSSNRGGLLCTYRRATEEEIALANPTIIIVDDTDIYLYPEYALVNNQEIPREVFELLAKALYILQASSKTVSITIHSIKFSGNPIYAIDYFFNNSCLPD